MENAINVLTIGSTQVYNVTGEHVTVLLEPRHPFAHDCLHCRCVVQARAAVAGGNAKAKVLSQRKVIRSQMFAHGFKSSCRATSMVVNERCGEKKKRKMSGTGVI